MRVSKLTCSEADLSMFSLFGRTKAPQSGDPHRPEYVGQHHHHRRQPWAQCPLVSDAIVTIAAHRCLSRAAWLNSCRVAPHHCSMLSDHSRWGRPLLFEPSIIPNTRVFIFLLSFILQIWPKRRNFLCITFCTFCQLNLSVQFFISDQWH